MIEEVVYFVSPSKLTSVSQYIHISLHFKACFSHKLTQQSAAFLMPFPPTARGIKFTVQGHTEVSCSYFMQYALKVYK